MDNTSGSELTLPGFRFHPTEEELIDFYLKNEVHGKKLQLDIISTVHLYQHDPWELPGMAKIGEREWYFFVPRDRKQSNGGRPSRTTEHGFWKATGTDRPVRSVADPKRLIGLKKTLVYYEGRAPRGAKTEWIMNEYRLPDHPNVIPKEDIVLCKIYLKPTPKKELEQRAALVEDAAFESQTRACSPAHSLDQEILQKPMTSVEDYDLIIIDDPKEEAELEDVRFLTMNQEDMPVMPLEIEETTPAPSQTSLPPLAMSLPELEVPRYDALDWTQDLFLSQLRSPWMDPCLSPYYAPILNI